MGNCTALDFNIHGLSEPRKSAKIRTPRLIMIFTEIVFNEIVKKKLNTNMFDLNFITHSIFIT